MSQTTKRCHWVPEAYLKAFAADSGKREKIWRVGKEVGEPELKAIEKVAVRFHLYVPRDASGRRDDSFEKKLSELERWFGHEVWLALQSEQVDLSWGPLRELIALLAAVMYLRNPRQLRLMESLHEQFRAAFARGPGGPPSAITLNGVRHKLDPIDWPEFVEGNEDYLKKTWIDDMNDAASIAERFLKMRWSMLVSEERGFVTSDAPVTILHPSLKFEGINNPDTFVLFPISPSHMLRMDNIRRGLRDRYWIVPPDDVALHNMMMWREAFEYMFSHRHPELVCAEL